MNKVPRWVFRYVGNKTFDFSSKKRIFCPKTTKFGPKLAFLVNLGHAGLFGALLVGRLVVVARGLYLARHLFTLLKYTDEFTESMHSQLRQFEESHHYKNLKFECKSHAEVPNKSIVHINSLNID